jgi:hypothetical protein
MRLRNALGLVVCTALLGTPGMAQAQDQEAQAQPRQETQPRQDAQARDQDRVQQHGTEEVGFRELRRNAEQYYGQTVTFEANVDSILGPNAVMLSSTSFWDWFGGNMLAYAPDALGVSVSNRDRVKVTGTAERYDQAQVREHLGWIDAGQDVSDDVQERAVIKITHITTDDGRNALIHEDHHQQLSGVQATGQAVGTAGADADRDRQQPGAADRDRQETAATDRDRDRQAVGTTGRMAPPITELDSAFDARRRDVGRSVNLQQVQVERMLGNQFFLAEREGNHILVKLPEGVERQGVQAGQRVMVQGVLMQMPDDIRRMPGVSEDAVEQVRNDDVYIMATNVRAGTEQPGAQQQQQRQPGQQPGQPQSQPGQPGPPQGQPGQPQGQPGQPQGQPGQPQGQPGQPQGQPDQGQQQR